MTRPAIGDGIADDTVAIQNALTKVRDGSVLYFPPGAYRITAPLTLKNAKAARWLGGLIVGCGRDTQWVWDGGEGGTMLTLDGMAYTRFVGFGMVAARPLWDSITRPRRASRQKSLNGIWLFGASPISPFSNAIATRNRR